MESREPNLRETLGVERIGGHEIFLHLGMSCEIFAVIEKRVEQIEILG